MLTGGSPKKYCYMLTNDNITQIGFRFSLYLLAKYGSKIEKYTDLLNK
jgi:hypothetical protein